MSVGACCTFTLFGFTDLKEPAEGNGGDGDEDDDDDGGNNEEEGEFSQVMCVKKTVPVCLWTSGNS